MALHITTNAADTQRTILDDENPHVYRQEFRCVLCNAWIPADEVLWALPDGTLSVIRGDPYCVSDAPEQPEY